MNIFLNHYLLRVIICLFGCTCVRVCLYECRVAVFYWVTVYYYTFMTVDVGWVIFCLHIYIICNFSFHANRIAFVKFCFSFILLYYFISLLGFFFSYFIVWFITKGLLGLFFSISINFLLFI